MILDAEEICPEGKSRQIVPVRKTVRELFDLVEPVVGTLIDREALGKVNRLRWQIDSVAPERQDNQSSQGDNQEKQQQANAAKMQKGN